MGFFINNCKKVKNIIDKLLYNCIIITLLYNYIIFMINWLNTQACSLEGEELQLSSVINEIKDLLNSNLIGSEEVWVIQGLFEDNLRCACSQQKI